MDKLTLVKPSTKYKTSFIKGHKNLYLHVYKGYNFKNVNLKKDFSKFIKFINSQANGRNLPKDYVPQTTFWLVRGNTYIGSASIRHKLNNHLKKIGGHIGYEIRPEQRRKGYGTQILNLALKKAKNELGLKKVLITCDKNNIGSKKIIEANGGKFASEYKDKSLKVPKLRYWINIK